MKTNIPPQSDPHSPPAHEDFYLYFFPRWGDPDTNIPPQKEIDEVIHTYMSRGWDRYRNKALRGLPEECEHMREEIEELLSEAFHQGGIAAAEGLQAVFEIHLARIKEATEL